MSSGALIDDGTRAPLLAVNDLAVEYRAGRSVIRAIDGVDLTVAARETVGLVGESGSGKTTLGRAILGLAAIREGAVAFDGTAITRAKRRQRRRLSAEMQVVFQDPFSSLNPTRTVGQTLAETARVHAQSNAERGQIDARVREMLERVGLPSNATNRFPGQFSGGQRQRIAIARALMVLPRLVICDEPVSALDLSIQAQVLNLLRQLQEEFELSYLLISHDLSVVRHLAHRIVVLYRGRVMESGDAGAIYDSAAHPYTQALLDAAPVSDPDLQRARRRARGAHRSDASGSLAAESCPFALRCEHALDVCRTVRPQLEATSHGTLVACHRWRELRPERAPASAFTDGRREGQR
jgi:oligopeptide/dipeptide ABC transporter ATP-binding protein